MKKIALLFLLIIAFNYNVFSQWHWQNPVPVGNCLNCVKFIGNSTGYIVGNCGTIMKSIDTGNTWSLQNSLTRNNLLGCYFTSANIGIVVGDSGKILKTTDGGINWIDISPALTNKLFSVCFINVDTGFVSGGGGIILKTTNGGNTWNSQIITNTGFSLRSICFVNQNTGFVVGADSTIFKTNDCGNTWLPHNVGQSAPFYSIFFVNDSIGYAGGYNSIYKTINGGNNWLKILNNNGQTTFSIFFNNADTGYIGGEGGRELLKTIDGGITWDTLTPLQSYVPIIFSLFFINDSTGFGVGFDANIFKTTDAGLTWQNKITYITLQHITSLYFTDSLNGFAACENGVLKTINGGNSWNFTMLDSNYYNWFKSIFFINHNVGYVVGQSGLIYKTIDGGDTWINKSFSNLYWHDAVYFLNNDTGFVAGGGGYLFKTTDGANSWVQITLGTSYALNTIFFVNDSVGYISGSSSSNSIILKTMDRGDTWQNMSLPWQYNTSYISSLFFLDNDYGIVSGGGFILKTLDGGNTWIYSLLSMNNNIIYRVRLIDYNTGYLIGTNGDILKTNDGGTNWINQNSITDNSLLAIFMTDTSHIWVAGNYGTIITKIDRDITTNFGQPNTINLYLKIFPNPATNSITIETPFLSKDALLTIFNIQGQLKLNRMIKEEKTEIDVSDFEKGMYFIRVWTDKGSMTKKFIKE